MSATDKCGICSEPVTQLFVTAKEGVYACFKCQPIVPEVTFESNTKESSDDSKEQDADPLLACGICHKTFGKAAQLQAHVRNHRAERRFVCTYCNKGFSQSNNLRAHLRIHTNERPYKCSECGKAFTQVTNLNNHMRLHTGERPFVCPEPGCNKAYAQVTNLNQHRKRHLSGRPLDASYECNVCGERFEQRNHMYTHRRSAHSELHQIVRSATRGAHVCGTCGALLPSERTLRLHAREHADSDDDKGYSCVFSSCALRFPTRASHTTHLLQAHQLRVLATPTPVQRGRPRKILKRDSSELSDPLAVDDCRSDVETKEVSMFNDVTIIKDQRSQFMPKLKVTSLFQ